jgi:hypothetical protein
MGKNLKKPKLKKLKVKKLRGGGADMGASSRAQERADRGYGSTAGVDRSAVGEGSQYQANVQAQQNKSSISPMAIASNALTVAGMFTNPLAAVAKFGYSQFKKGKQNKMDYEGQAAGVTPMSAPRTTYATNTRDGAGSSQMNKTVAQASQTLTPKPLFANTDTTGSASNFMVRPGVKLAPLSMANMPKASSQGFMLKPGVALSDVAKASNGKLIKGHPKLAKKGWK